MRKRFVARSTVARRYKTVFDCFDVDVASNRKRMSYKVVQKRILGKISAVEAEGALVFVAERIFDSYPFLSARATACVTMIAI